MIDSDFLMKELFVISETKGLINRDFFRFINLLKYREKAITTRNVEVNVNNYKTNFRRGEKLKLEDLLKFSIYCKKINFLKGILVKNFKLILL